MIVIACVDDSGGMMFNHRRQSQDRVLREDVLRLCQGGRLYMSPYSYGMFGDMPMDGVEAQACASCLQETPKGAYCFVEEGALQAFEDALEGLVLYKWNRKYPADTYFSLDLGQGGWELAETVDFQGSSHERITRERYQKVEGRERGQ